MKDSVVIDEINHDLQDQKATEAYEMCVHRATQAYNHGDLRPDMIEAVQDSPIDVLNIAQTVLDAIDNDIDVIEHLSVHCSLNIRDFRATRDGIITCYAEELYEGGE